MDFRFYAMENGLIKFSQPKMNGKITLSIFGMENNLVLFWYLEHLTYYFKFLSKQYLNECLEISRIVIQYRPCIQLHFLLSGDFLISFVSSGQY